MEDKIKIEFDKAFKNYSSNDELNFKKNNLEYFIKNGFPGRKIESWEIDFLSTRHCDLEYCYYVWQHPLKETWISIFEGYGVAEDMKCIFVGKPQQLIDKYKTDTND